MKAWTELVTALANVYEKWLDTREAAYERKRDKNQEKAISAAESGLGLTEKLIELIELTGPFNGNAKREYYSLKNKIERRIKKFNKYD